MVRAPARGGGRGEEDEREGGGGRLRPGPGGDVGGLTHASAGHWKGPPTHPRTVWCLLLYKERTEG